MSTDADKQAFRDKLRSISFGTVPGGTRSQAVARIDQTERQWSQDIDAYRRLRKEGRQPPAIDGSATREKHAETAAQVDGTPKVEV